ncbi:MAG TPA: AAA family ATPase, partial [Ilumatobacteraceae bacterium]
MPQRWPFVGRDEEVRVLLESLRTSNVMIGGVAGVGKSRLATELIDRVESSGQRVARCVANHSTLTVPFGAMVHLLPPMSDRVTDLTQVLSSARLHLSETYRGGLVAVDDAHLLDAASASLVHHLARDGQVGVLVIVRSSEPAPDAIEALWKDGLVERIDLQPLSVMETRLILETVCRGAVSDQTVNRFFAISEGNAMFLNELVSEALERGELVEVDGTWRWSGSIRGTMRLATMVERHMERLSPTAKRVLELVAMVEPLPVTLLERLTTPDAVETAEQDGLIVVGRDRGDVRVRHPLFGEVLYARMGAGAFRRNVRDLSTEMLADDGIATPTQVTRLAILHLESGLPGSAELFNAAARHAIASGDSALGERLAGAAIAVDGGSYASVMSLALARGAQRRFAEVAEILAGLEGSEPDEASIAELSYARMRALLF